MSTNKRRKRTPIKNADFDTVEDYILAMCNEIEQNANRGLYARPSRFEQESY